MNLDPTMNVVVFKPRRGKPIPASAPTRHDDCIHQAWEEVKAEHRIRAIDVTAVHSEWEPSDYDGNFMKSTFSNLEETTYNFRRPAADGWDAAFEAARREMLQVADQFVEAAPQVMTEQAHPTSEPSQSLDEALRRIRDKAERDKADTTPLDDMDQVDRDGVLLPVLRSDTASGRMRALLPHQDVAPGLYVALATVAMKPNGKIGMNHTTHHGVEAMGSPFSTLLEQACANLRDGLKVDGMLDGDGGEFLRLHRPEKDVNQVSSAVVLPDFYETMAGFLDAEGQSLVVAIPCPDELLVAVEDSGPGRVILPQMMRDHPYLEAHLEPSLLRLTSSGIELLEERTSS